MRERQAEKLTIGQALVSAVPSHGQHPATHRGCGAGLHRRLGTPPSPVGSEDDAPNNPRPATDPLHAVRKRASDRHWADHLSSGVTVGWLIEELTAALDRRKETRPLLQYVARLENAIAAGDAAAWRAIKALEGEDQ